MRVSSRLIGMLIIISFFIVGCNSSTEKSIPENDNTSKEKNVPNAVPSENQATAPTDGKSANNNNEYPLPILSGWVEKDTSFKVIGNGTIDLWRGQFSFEGEIDDYFELYQVALKEVGFEVTVNKNVEGRKTLDFTQIIAGDKHFGHATFSHNLITTGIQHFK